MATTSWTIDPDNILALIRKASVARKCVVIRYSAFKYGGQRVTRLIEPYSTRWKRRGRYLFGYDTGQDGNPTVGIHMFLIDKIVSVQVIDQEFRPRYALEL